MTTTETPITTSVPLSVPDLRSHITVSAPVDLAAVQVQEGEPFPSDDVAEYVPATQTVQSQVNRPIPMTNDNVPQAYLPTTENYPFIQSQFNQIPISTTSQTSSKLRIEAYSDKSFVVVGDSRPYRLTLRKMGGSWNKFLKDGVKGWIFSNMHEVEVHNYIEGVNSGAVRPDDIQPKTYNNYRGESRGRGGMGRGGGRGGRNTQYQHGNPGSINLPGVAQQYGNSKRQVITVEVDKPKRGDTIEIKERGTTSAYYQVGRIGFSKSGDVNKAEFTVETPQGPSTVTLVIQYDSWKVMGKMEDHQIKFI